MNHKTLIFLTDSFPFGTGETFIENEIIYLADFFDKIIIIPMQTVSIQKKRPLPENVYTTELQKENIKWCSILKTIICNHHILIEFVANIIINPLRNKILLKALINSLSIKENINRVNNTAKSTCSYYSYWLNDAAIALGLIKTGIRISRAHGWDVYKERHLYSYLPLRKFLAEKLTEIYCISDNGTKTLIKETNCENIILSRLGTLNNKQINFSIDNSFLFIISIGNAIPLKRLHIIGETIIQLNNDNIKWIHFGDGPLLTVLKQNYPKGLFYGQISNSMLKTKLFEYASNALLINTSTSEGIPVSMMEAMSFGIPCIGPDVGGISEIISDGFNGYLLRPHVSIKETVDKILFFYNSDTANKSRLKENAFNTWAKNYNANTNYPHFINQAFKNNNP